MNNFLKNIKYIYFDMDGVIANLGSQLLDDQNNQIESRSEKIKRFKAPNFYINLPAYKKNIDAIKELLLDKRFTVYILSSSQDERVDFEKKEWLKTHLPEMPKENIILTRSNGREGDPKRKKKVEYVKTPLSESLLVDDYFINLTEWKSAGGKCIKYVNEWDSEQGRHQEAGIEHIKCLRELII